MVAKIARELSVRVFFYCRGLQLGNKKKHVPKELFQEISGVIPQRIKKFMLETPEEYLMVFGKEPLEESP